MDPTGYEIKIEQVIRNRLDHSEKSHHLCFWGGKLCCLPKGHTDKPHREFANLTQSQMQNGLKSATWARLGKTVEQFFKKELKK